MDDIDPQMENQVNKKSYGNNFAIEKELTPFEYTKVLTNQSIHKIGIASILVVSYMLLTALLGAFIEFGGIWWGITLSYFVAIGSGIAFVVARFIANEELVKQYEKEYKLNSKKTKK